MYFEMWGKEKNPLGSFMFPFVFMLTCEPIRGDMKYLYEYIVRPLEGTTEFVLV